MTVRSKLPSTVCLIFWGYQKVDTKLFQKHGHGKSKQKSSYPKKFIPPCRFHVKRKKWLKYKQNKGINYLPPPLFRIACLDLLAFFSFTWKRHGGMNFFGVWTFLLAFTMSLFLKKFSFYPLLLPKIRLSLFKT